MADQRQSHSTDLPEDYPALKGLSPEEMKMRKRRNLVIALSLGAFIVLVFAVTILRIGGAVADRSF